MVLSPPRTTAELGHADRSASAVLDVVVPVYNEARQLAASVRRLRRYLDVGFPFSAILTIVDNGSTDATPEIAEALGRDLENVRVVRLSQKGRGRALRAAWSTSRAEIVCYMDVDLSTSLEALFPLVAPLISGHSDLAIGSRLAPGARVVRGARRELISRGYNLLLHATLHSGFSDAQCGFKAARAQVAKVLLPLVEDESWFFDTELLVLAERSGLRIHEVAVDWVDDPDSTVRIARTVADDLRGIWRLILRRRRADTVECLPGRSHRRHTRRLAKVGITSTILYAVLFLLFRSLLGVYAANALSLAICTVANAAAHRRFVEGQEKTAFGGFVLGMAVGFVPAICFTSLGLLFADMAGGGDLRIAVALLAATAAAALVRFCTSSSLAFHFRPDPEREVIDQ
jgi:glycosyltransferase involved in cell wall biosynthesis